MIVCPGGGYSILAYDLEGTEIAEWLQGIGVTALVLKYRVPKLEGEEPGQRPLMDLQRAVRTVRSRAGELKIDPAKIGVLGFSAGGHLVVMAGTQYARSAYEPQDDVDSQSAKPDFLIPIYPAYLADSDAVPPKLRDAIVVTKDTPPTFLTVTHDDDDRGVGAALLSMELKRHDVPCELHIFVQGGHGYGLRESENAVSHWPHLCEQWLRAQKIIDAAKGECGRCEISLRPLPRPQDLSLLLRLGKKVKLTVQNATFCELGHISGGGEVHGVKYCYGIYIFCDKDHGTRERQHDSGAIRNTHRG